MTDPTQTMPPFPKDVVVLLEEEAALATQEATSWQPPSGMMERVAQRLPWDVLSTQVPGSTPATASAGTKAALGVKATLVAGLLAGAAVGTGVTLWAVQGDVLPGRVVTVGVPVPVVVAAPPDAAAVVTPVVVPAGQGAARPTVAKKAAAPAPAQPSPTTSDPAAERALLQRARSALARREPGLALQALEEHRERFPASQLAEDRDALGILSLAADGKLDAARAALARFRRSYPQSPMLPALENLPATSR